MIKILFVITGLSKGGAEAMLLKVIERIDRNQFSPYVISLTDIGYIGEELLKLRIPVTAYGLSSTYPNPLFIFKLIKKIKEIKPDIVHTWMYHADFLGGLAAKFSGVKNIAWCIRHSNLEKSVNKSSTLLIAKICARLSYLIPKKIVVCSEVSKHIHAEFGYCLDKMFVIPNGFDIDNFKPNFKLGEQVRLELGVDQKTPLIAIIGRYHPQKNYLGFLDAFYYAKHSIPDLHALLIGKGVDYGNLDLLNSIKHKELEQSCCLLGHRDDVANLLTSIDVLVSSSYGEGFSNTIGEAMASGVPCAVTNVGDSAYIVGETGISVESDDMYGLAEAIKKLISLPKEQRKKIGEVARERVVKNFEIKDVVKRYEDFYFLLIK